MKHELLQGLTSVDLVFLGIAIVTGIRGFLRGIWPELFSLVAWLGASWLTFKDPSMPYAKVHGLAPFLPMTTVGAAAFFFVILLQVGGLVSRILLSAISKLGMQDKERVTGAAFGILRGMVIGAVVVRVGDASGLSGLSAWKQSRVIPLIQPIADGLLSEHAWNWPG